MLDDHFWYYFIKDTGTHIYWLAHPRWIAPNITFDVCIDKIMASIRDKKIFNVLPEGDEKIIKKLKNDTTGGDEMDYSSIEYKRQYLLDLAKFLCKHEKVMSGGELCSHFNRNGILTGYATQYAGGRGIYTLIRETWYWYYEDQKDHDSAKYIEKAFVKEDGTYAYQ